MTHTHNTYLTDNPLFKRNPVCGVCWRVCTELCEEWGGQINFDLLESMEVADKLCRRLILNTWTLCGIEYYYHWLEGQLGFSRPAVTCATAVVCLTLRLMDGLNEGLHRPCSRSYRTSLQQQTSSNSVRARDKASGANLFESYCKDGATTDVLKKSLKTRGGK